MNPIVLAMRYPVATFMHVVSLISGGLLDLCTRGMQQVALAEFSFFPGTDMRQAMAQVVALSDQAMSLMPRGTLPLMMNMRMDDGSVPVAFWNSKASRSSHLRWAM